MVENDTRKMQFADIAHAAALLTRLPLPVGENTRGAATAWAYPIVGLIIGVLAALIGVIGLWVGLPSAAVALLSLATMILLTGAMHEDGLADTADGFWGGWTREARLEIMKDSHIGTYGVLSLIIVTAARWLALWHLFDIGAGTATAALVAACTLSRASMPSLMANLPHARTTGLSHSVGATSKSTAWIAWGIALLAAFVLTGWGVFWAAIWAAVVTLGIARLARHKIGGQTGDTLGAAQQVSEVAVLFSLLV